MLQKIALLCLSLSVLPCGQEVSARPHIDTYHESVRPAFSVQRERAAIKQYPFLALGSSAAAQGNSQVLPHPSEKIIAAKDQEITQKTWMIIAIVFLMVTKLFFMILAYTYWRKKKNLEIAALKSAGDIRELEHQQKLLEERDRIAREMHDDLGTTLTSTIMAAEMMKRSPGAREPLEMMQRSSEMLSGQINDIVWNLNTHNDNLAQLSNYILRFAQSFLTNAGITLMSEEKLQEQAVAVEGHKRRSIYLAVKEILNNTVKHSGASEVKIHVWYHKPLLSIAVSDNGKGFEGADLKSRGGNGLNNIRQSIRQLEGKATWNTGSRSGTNVTLEIPLSTS